MSAASNWRSIACCRIGGPTGIWPPRSASPPPRRSTGPGRCGSEDFLLHVAVADNQQLYAFVIDKLTERPEVADVRTSVIYEHLRNHAVAPAARP